MIKILILFFYLLLLTLSTSREGTNCKVKTLTVLSITIWRLLFGGEIYYFPLQQSTAPPLKASACYVPFIHLHQALHS